MKGVPGVPNNIASLNSPDFRIRASLGLVPGVIFIRKFGFNGSLPNSVERDVWDYGSTALGNVNYSFLSDNATLFIDTISSSSSSDVGKMVLIEGLDTDGNIKTQSAILNGQNKVTLSFPLWRVYRMSNITPNSSPTRGTGFNGIIYCYVNTTISGGVPVDTSKVKAIINDGNNQTLMTPYTIPKGYTGVFLWQTAKIAGNVSGTINLKAYSRPYGREFNMIDIGALSVNGSSILTESIQVPGIIPERTDVVVTTLDFSYHDEPITIAGTLTNTSSNVSSATYNNVFTGWETPFLALTDEEQATIESFYPEKKQLYLYLHTRNSTTKTIVFKNSDNVEFARGYVKGVSTAGYQNTWYSLNIDGTFKLINQTHYPGYPGTYGFSLTNADAIAKVYEDETVIVTSSVASDSGFGVGYANGLYIPNSLDITSQRIVATQIVVNSQLSLNATLYNTLGTIPISDLLLTSFDLNSDASNVVSVNIMDKAPE